MSIRVSCSFCHELNDISYSRYCHNCGHRADLSRMECDCPYCGNLAAAARAKAAPKPTTPNGRAAAPPPNAVDTPSCPVCNGPMYDNRPDKQRGEFLNSPDLRCRDKDCEGRYVTYPPKEGEKRPNPPKGRGSSTSAGASSARSRKQDEPPPPDDDGFLGDLPGGV